MVYSRVKVRFWHLSATESCYTEIERPLVPTQNQWGDKMRKKILWAAMSTMIIVGLSFYALPFFLSMAPSKRAGEDLPYINVDSIQPGDLVTHDSQGDGNSGWGTRYIVYRDYSGEFNVFWVMVRDGQVSLPDLRWWRPGPLCEDFRPEIRDGKVVENSTFRCRSPISSGDWWSNEWKWSLEGRNLGKITDDMEVVRYSIEGNHLILGKG